MQTSAWVRGWLFQLFLARRTAKRPYLASDCHTAVIKNTPILAQERLHLKPLQVIRVRGQNQ